MNWLLKPVHLLGVHFEAVRCLYICKCYPERKNTESP